MLGASNPMDTVTTHCLLSAFGALLAIDLAEYVSNRIRRWAETEPEVKS